MKYRVISTDDHLQEGPTTWTDRMDQKKWGSKIPHVKRMDDGNDKWFMWDEMIGAGGGMTGGIGSVHGAMPDRTVVPMRYEDMPKIAYVPSERIKAMDQDGVDVHTFFPNVAGLAGHRLNSSKMDEAFRIEAIRAANDFQLEEYAAAFPGRFITLALLPMWDVNLAVEELARTAKLGTNGVTFAFPEGWGFNNISDPYWDPLWELAQETGLSINFHFGASGNNGIGELPAWEGHSDLRRLAQNSARSMASNITIMCTILFSGILERFPRLNIVSSESGLGWIPYLLELADHQWDRQKIYREGMDLKPSDYFRRQCYANFWFEMFGPAVRQYIGIDNIMWESDFPHPTCTWPESQSYIERSMSDWSEEERHQVLVGNAARVFHLDAS